MSYPEVIGFYEKQPSMVNGRDWYQNIINDYAIYLADNGNWHINDKKYIGTSYSYIWTSGQYMCPHNSNNRWKYWYMPHTEEHQVMEDPTLRVQTVPLGKIYLDKFLF